jgi:two-component system, LytTR family, response regulator
MDKLRAYVVDDERLAVERLVRLLEATGRVAIAGSTTDSETALAYLREHLVDVLFLDIQMPGLTGFDLLERLNRDDLPVVFTTAYDRYAVEAFEVNSVDYLLKPIEPERLDRALDRCQTRAAPRPDPKTFARDVAAHLTGRRALERMASRSGERTVIFETARVSHFIAKDKLTFAVVNGHEHVIDFTLNQLEALLDPRRFARIHRNALVNVNFVQELDAWVDGGVLVRLKDDQRTELSVARDRVRPLKERLGI